MRNVFLIIVLGLVAYINSTSGGFVWDDLELVRDNNYIKNWDHLQKIFTTDIRAGAGRLGNTYRPIQTLTYMAGYSLWGLDVRGYHLTNILVHIAAALAVYWFVNLICKNKFISLTTGILFVIHPVHTEAVSYISGTADPLAALFTMLCIIFYIKGLHSKNAGFYLLTLFFFVCALLSKENSLVIPFLLMSYHYAFKEKIRPGKLALLLGIFLAYVIMRLTVFNFPPPYTAAPNTLAQRLPGFFVALTTYARIILLPFGLHMEYGDNTFPITDIRAITGFLILISILIISKRMKKTGGVSLFAISWFLINILPVSNLYRINAYMAEHWLYLPSAGLFLLIAQGLYYVYDRKQLKTYTIVFLSLISGFYCLLTIRQNNYWRHPVNFYEKTLQYAPNSARLYNNLAALYHEAGRKEEAIPLYEKAIEINPKFAEIYNNLGILYKDMGMVEQAVDAYKKAIEKDPRYAHAYNNLGIAYHGLKRHNDALDMYRKAIEINPFYEKAYVNLGNVYEDTGRSEEAIALHKKAIGINPDYEKAYYNLGIAYNNIGRYNEAITLYKKAIAIKPDYLQAYNNLGNAYKATGREEEAIESYKKVIEINPKDVYGYNNLGNSYRAIGRINEAVSAYKKAIEFDPGNAVLHYNLAIAYYTNKEYNLAIRHCDKARELGYNVAPGLLEALRPYRGR